MEEGIKPFRSHKSTSKVIIKLAYGFLYIIEEVELKP